MGEAHPGAWWASHVQHAVWLQVRAASGYWLGGWELGGWWLVVTAVRVVPHCHSPCFHATTLPRSRSSPWSACTSRRRYASAGSET